MEVASAAGKGLALPALSYFINKLASCFGGDVTLDEMQHLKNIVNYQIKALIGKVKLDASDEAMQLWEKLQAASSELDDLFDMYEYKQIEKQVSSSSSNPIKKFTPVFKENLGPIYPKSYSRYRLEKLLKFVEQVEKIEQLITSRTDTTQPQADTITPTTSTLSSPYFGRENQCKSIIDFLLRDSHANKVPVIAITGIGGSGKSHTAQYICNDNTIKEHFDAIMWLHVARDFNVEQLTRKMFESATNKKCPNFENLDTLQKKLIKSLSKDSKRKRFLFVLDDVWCGDNMKWDLLVGPLNEAVGNGSRIIITTQSEKIAFTLGAEIVELGKLDDRECWSIIKHYAFVNIQEITEDEGLSYVENTIISKLKESPLALRVVGNSLRGKGSVNEWVEKYNQDKLKEVMDHLLYSYNHLPLHLRQCFAYCGLFPKGYKFYIDFRKQEPHLISLWIAQGFIKNTGGLTLEEAGKNYIEELLSQSFFEKKSKDCFEIPNLLHDLAETVSTKYCYRVECHDSLKIPETCLHLSFSITGNFSSPAISGMKAEISKLTNLRTLIILRGPVLENIFQNGEAVLPKLINLRALYVCPDQLMGAQSIGRIDKLKTLRYLHVQYGEKLPKSLAKLYLLKIFILIRLQNDRKYLEADTLPEGFDNLIELRTLKFYAENGNELDYLYYNSKINVGKLKSLTNLMAFYPEKDGSKGMMSLGGLSLCGSLSVLNLENVQSKVEAEKAMLKRKNGLNELIFEWSSTSNVKSNIYTQVLDGLEPHENLKKLEIVGYQGARFPDWMNRLPRCQTLTLRSCKSPNIYPFLPPHIQNLYVHGYNELMQLYFVGETGHTLILYDHQKWMLPAMLPSIFKSSNGLCMLSIKGCSIDYIKLSSLANLKYLYLVGLPSLHTITKLSSTVILLTIEDCPNLISLGNLQHCTSLQRLSVKNCPICLPNLDELSSLEELLITCCYDVESLPNLPVSLRSITVEDSPKLKEKYEEGGRLRNTISHIPDIRIY